MAIRTTEAAVRLILDDDTTIDMTPFIEAASSMVDDVCTNSGYTSAKLELIERWLSAHFYHQRDKPLANEQAGSVGAGYQYKLGLMLANTHYGQTAMMLDYKGNLAALSKRLEKGRVGTVGVKHLGVTDSKGNDISE